MGLLSIASTLDSNKGLAFSDFIKKHSLKNCAVLKINGNSYSVYNSIGFDGISIITATSTIDFWNGICNQPDIIKHFEKKDNSINPLLQLFSERMKENLENLYVVKNSSDHILISEQEITNQSLADFSELNDTKHLNKIEKLNSLIKENSFVLKFQIDFSEAIDSFLSSQKNPKDTINFERTALLNELYNRFICSFNNIDASTLTKDNILKTVFITDRNYSIELITNHIILNLREVLSDSAELTQINYMGTAESYTDTKNFLQAE